MSLLEIREIPEHPISIRFAPQNEATVAEMLERISPLKECELRIRYAHLEIQREFDELLCPGTLNGVEHYWYQIETVKKVLKYFRGRVLLCDEVGLGKTIEAGMIMKEYLLRGMVKRVLILTPASLVSQWKEEMALKFGVSFLTTEDPSYQLDPEAFWKNNFIIASIHTAKSEKNVSIRTNQMYDLVIVDEAHHLKNRTTLAWKLVNEIQKRFIFLLSATPVQNDLIELFNLITLLKPGQFKTEKLFRSEYVARGNLRIPLNKEKLRELLRDCMIRNTRSAIDLKLPGRFATTLKLQPSEREEETYQGLTNFVRSPDAPFSKMMIQLLLREAGSSPFALKETLEPFQMIHEKAISPILESIHRLPELSKGKALVELLLKKPEEKIVIFSQYLKSMDYVAELLTRSGFRFANFRGGMTAREKEEAIRQFKEDMPILNCSESGGEGRNLQFCNTLINFDLPWNPMKIEQRIGRLHRIGQTRDVFVFNLCLKGTIEEYILEILESKINMFEMVIGEIEPILGHLSEEKEFEETVLDIWLKSTSKEEAGRNFEELGDKLLKAREDYVRSKELDLELFGQDYEL